MNMKAARDAIGGALMVLVGLYALARAFEYGLGTATRMGPGYFPMMLGCAAIATGIGIALPAILRLAGRDAAARAASGSREAASMSEEFGSVASGQAPRVAWRPLAAIAAGMALFVLSLPSLGLLPAVALAAVLSALGDREVSLRSLPLLVAAICLGAWAIFSWGLGIRVPLFRWF